MTVKELKTVLQYVPEEMEIFAGIKYSEPFQDSSGKFLMKTSNLVNVEISPSGQALLVLGTDGEDGKRSRREITSRYCPILNAHGESKDNS